MKYVKLNIIYLVLIWLSVQRCFLRRLLNDIQQKIELQKLS